MPEREYIYAKNAAGFVKRMLRSSLYHKDGWEECEAPPPPQPRPPRAKRARRVPEPPAPKSARKRAETKEQ